MRRGLAIATTLALAITTPFARPARAADDAGQSAKLAEAQELFHRGVALNKVEAYDRALDLFLRSRELVPSGANTIAAASCLDKLGRYDEALEMAEEVAAKYSGSLDAHNRAMIGPMLADLRKKVGSLVVTSDVDATLIVDGRGRGKVPLPSPLRLLAGRHVVRIVKPGYTPHEQTMIAAPGVLVAIDARLQLVPGAGVLRVEDPSLEGANVFVDGARVGTVPWEATMPAGPHVVRTEGGDRGSVPTEILVVPGQTSLARPPSRELGEVLNLSVDPLTATLSIDGVFVARGRWMGRLPKGPHEVTAAEPGYKTRRATVNDGFAPSVRRLTLRVDPNDPHWPHAAPGRFVASAFAAFAVTRSLHTGAAATVNEDGTYIGPLAGVRLGFRLPIGIAPELTLGYLSVRGSFTRGGSDSFVVGNRHVDLAYHFNDAPWVRGPFGLAGASLTRNLWRLRWISRVAVGALYARTSDAPQGFVDRAGHKPPLFACYSKATDCALVAVARAGQVVGSLPPAVGTEFGAAYPFRSFDLGLALGAVWIPDGGSKYSGRSTEVHKPCPPGPGADIGCVAGSYVIAAERAYGPFVLWSPEVFASFPF